MAEIMAIETSINTIVIAMIILPIVGFLITILRDLRHHKRDMKTSIFILSQIATNERKRIEEIIRQKIAEDNRDYIHNNMTTSNNRSHMILSITIVVLIIWII